MFLDYFAATFLVSIPLLLMTDDWIDGVGPTSSRESESTATSVQGLTSSGGATAGAIASPDWPAVANEPATDTAVLSSLTPDATPLKSAA